MKKRKDLVYYSSMLISSVVWDIEGDIVAIHILVSHADLGQELLVDWLVPVFTPVEFGVLTLAYVQLVLATSPQCRGDQAEGRELWCPTLLLDPVDEFRK